MKVAGFIADRIAFNRQRSFSRFIIRLSIAATVISVMVMIITLAFANGFQETVSQKVFSFWGHIRVIEKQPDKALIAEETPIIANDTVVRAIRSNSDVVSIHPFATRYAVLKTNEEIEGVLVKGLDSTYHFDNFSKFIKEGRPIKFFDTTYSREIMISATTASLLKLKLNDGVLIYFIRPDGTFRPDKLTISGIYKTGIEEYDKTFAIADIKLIRRLNFWEKNEIGGYEIFLSDHRKIEDNVNSIQEMDEFPYDWDTVSAKRISSNIFDWLNMQDLTRNVLIIIVIIVAVINLVTCLIILVMERLKMIGILKAVGASDWTVQKIFLRHSLYITLTGIIIGALLAIAILALQVKTGFIRLKEQAYYLETAAVKIEWWEIGLICAGTLLVSLLILLIPSFLVKKIQPVKAIHFQ